VKSCVVLSTVLDDDDDNFVVIAVAAVLSLQCVHQILF
jgi:hypothetical protein